jgi:hypothetical protein
MTSTQSWKTFFTEWPADFPSGGVIVSTLNEVIPFRKFWIKDDLLLLERNAPDANGGRFVIFAFDAVNSIKFVNPMTDLLITNAGFLPSGVEHVLQKI